MTSATFKRTIILLIIPFILTSCLRVPSYDPRPLSVLSGRFNAISMKKHVTARVKVMHKRDIIGLFGKRGAWLSRSRRSTLIPLHLSIDNHSNHSFAFGPEDINLEILSYEQVCKRMLSNGGLWALGTLLLGYPAGLMLTIGGFFAIPLGSSIGSPALLNAGWASFATGFCLMVATPFAAMGNAVRSVEGNKELELDLHQKMLKPNTIIRPYEHMEALVFVKRAHYKRELTITLHSIDESEKPYIVALNL